MECKELQAHNSGLVREITEAKSRKQEAKKLKEELRLLKENVNRAESELFRETERAKALELKFSKRKKRLGERDQNVEVELAKTEARIEELKVLVRMAEAGENRLREVGKERQQMTEKRSLQQEKDVKQPSTFVINDNLRISQSEIANLREMIESIQTENKDLEEEKDSLIMDYECMMRENLGLKQMIEGMKGEGH
jgi:DNA repair exonuclease SbcCD ATPase subunit